MEKENYFYNNNPEETGARSIDIREIGQWDPVEEFQNQINDEIDEKLEKDEQLRQLKEDRARLKKLWGEIMAKNYNEKSK